MIMSKKLETLVVTLSLSWLWSGSTIMGNFEGAIVIRPLGVKFLITITTLKPMLVPLLGHAKQEEGIALMGGMTRIIVGERLLVSCKMGKTIVACK